ncbi:HTH-type transcriptional regulator, transcriptional repressor of NAD biosynthesis genes [Hymenobacter gelipurpurascens]|uniref:HTH-type transcriptional regulator, transcriptional repressor of NAD biosynthesis genes n=1 Tax=Hymenobacter gelipurpurascens TaxID=89968 RepID=A0A212TLQ0_9BACT|nr:AAA family ATPase [Hymenobacter gelipurpurascens]SNC66766.1 HTH-type transcriptional regulator, transcriptional repressor of NAD biosynthesis genes [Hymenobacter gelipurpurascens]
MTHAFVFGKFLPFHRGHQKLIDFARQHCDLLTVLVCASDQEPVAGTVRAQWIRAENEKAGSHVQVQVYAYNEAELPNTSETSAAVARVWAEVFHKLLPSVSLVVTSEPYGALVAQYMGIQYLDFDVERAQVPVSASAIRADLRGNWEFLPAGVQAYYRRTVAILGTESTGKTTLTQQLADHFGASCVLETARELIADSSDFSTEDLYAVAAEHAQRIKLLRPVAGPLLLLDTDVHITQSYARFTGNGWLELPPELYALNRADLYLYLLPDVPFVQDGTRLSAPDRQRLDEAHRQTLAHFGTEYQIISGTWAERFSRATQLLEELLHSAATA